ncbi:hypothetical protein ATANTOWER_026619 [Ataeniobius toweri]|uniref:Uncharacterized protein n=1 Tax=Ataeniobius toweri TaxID=208326 RepID=A0ABU7AKU8_9TELE|nr:hypothetical protein [Ataeniobius toweri]
MYRLCFIYDSSPCIRYVWNQVNSCNTESLSLKQNISGLKLLDHNSNSYVWHPQRNAIPQVKHGCRGVIKPKGVCWTAKEVFNFSNLAVNPRTHPNQQKHSSIGSQLKSRTKCDRKYVGSPREGC